jgi:glycine/D-amino acid oxidase-like deaminating enzyme
MGAWNIGGPYAEPNIKGQLFAKCDRLERELEDARLARDRWKERCEKTERESNLYRKTALTTADESDKYHRERNEARDLLSDWYRWWKGPRVGHGWRLDAPAFATRAFLDAQCGMVAE